VIAETIAVFCGTTFVRQALFQIFSSVGMTGSIGHPSFLTVLVWQQAWKPQLWVQLPRHVLVISHQDTWVYDVPVYCNQSNGPPIGTVHGHWQKDSF
jgi:hypothetical protein